MHTHKNNIKSKQTAKQICLCGKERKDILTRRRIVKKNVHPPTDGRTLCSLIGIP